VQDTAIAYVRADEALAQQLSDDLQLRGISTNLRVLRLGDSLYDSVQECLRSARYTVLVLSRGFFSRPWPRGDLDQLARIDRDYQGETKLLPVWHGISQQDIAFYSTALAEKIGVLTSGGLLTVIAEIADVVQPGGTAFPPDTGYTKSANERVGSSSTDLVRLRNQLNDYFSWEELDDLCFRLGISIDDLPGSTRSSKAQELVTYFHRRGRLDQLLSHVRTLRPHVSQRSRQAGRQSWTA